MKVYCSTLAIFGYINPGSQAVGSNLVPRTVSLGRVQLGLSMLLHSSVCVLLPVHVQYLNHY